MKIREMRADDWKAVSQIYELGIETGLATFESKVPTWDNWDKGHLASGRFVLIVDDQIAAWCALSPISSRQVYKGVAEVSIYVDPDYRGQALGRTLLDYLVQWAFSHGFWTLQSGIIAANLASVKLHEACDFRCVGYRESIAQLRGSWQDTVLYEKRKGDD